MIRFATTRRLLTSSLLCSFGAAGALSAQTTSWDLSDVAFSADPFGSLVGASTMWDPDGAGPMPPRLVAAGFFQQLGGVASHSVVSRDASTGVWSGFGSGVTFEIGGVAGGPNGELVVGGGPDVFVPPTTPGTVEVWDGSSWTRLPGLDGFVSAVAVLPGGDIVVAGAFSNAGGVAVTNTARWDGSTWHSMGGALDGMVRAMRLLSDGRLIAVRFFPTGSPIELHEWNGTAWVPLGPGAGNVSAFGITQFIESATGDIVATGVFADMSTGTLHAVARWDGSSWQHVGTGIQDATIAIAELPGGDLVVGGSFDTAEGQPANNIARFDGTNWTELAGGLGQRFEHQVQSLIVTPEGELFAFGFFDTAGIVGTKDGHVARLATSAPAAATLVGTGGAATVGGAGATQDLAALALPWLGAEVVARGTNFAPAASVVSLIGFASLSAPLGLVFPQATAGSTLLVDPTVTRNLAVVGNAATGTLAVPDDPSILGTVFFEQMLSIEVGGAGLTAIGATNALRWVVGGY